MTDGYGAFTVNHSPLETARGCIAMQDEHRRIGTFAEECRACLVRHGIASDERSAPG